jgi:hypothetical protein
VKSLWMPQRQFRGGGGGGGGGLEVTRWKWVDTVTPQGILSPGKSPQYTLNRELGGPQETILMLRIGENITAISSVSMQPFHWPCYPDSSFQAAILRDASDTPTSEAHVSMIFLLTVKDRICEVRWPLKIIFPPCFVKVGWFRSWW